MKIGFCGSGVFAADCLVRISQKIKPEWVITNAPRPAGRGLKLKPTEVSIEAEKLGIECKTTERLSSDMELLSWVSQNCPDVILVIDFGHMVKEPFLSMPTFGCLNIHPSRLPQYRGSAPVQTAIMNGDASTAVSIFRLDAGMDSGPLLSQMEVAIDMKDDTSALLAKCAAAGANELLRLLYDVPVEKWQLTKQKEEGVSYAPKIEKSQGRIDWNKSSSEIYNLIRAIGETTGTYCFVNGKRLRIHKTEISQHSGCASEILALDCGMPIVGCGKGSLKLLSVQPEGKKTQSADEWFRGSRMKTGGILGLEEVR